MTEPKTTAASKNFPAKHYSESPVGEALKKEEINILWFQKDEGNTHLYKQFNSDFSLFLNKMGSSPVKNIVDYVFKKGLIFIGVSKEKSPAVFSRLLLTTDMKIAGIVLESSDLDIDLGTGETPRIDDCIYATYYSMIRSAAIVHKKEIQKDVDLHKVLSTYLYLIILRALGRGAIYNERQKEYIKICCIYLYLRHFLKQKHLTAINNIKRHYGDIINQEFMQDCLDTIMTIDRYDSLKDISKLLLDIRVFTGNPNLVIVTLLNQLSAAGFYSIVGPLDLFIGLSVLSKYPTGIFSKNALVSDKLQSTIESMVLQYVKNIKYSVTTIKREY